MLLAHFELGRLHVVLRDDDVGARVDGAHDQRLLVGERRGRGCRAVDGDVAVEVEVGAQPAHRVLAVLLRRGELPLRRFQRRLGAENVDLRHLAGFVEGLGLRAAFLSEIDVLLLDVDARVGVEDAEIVRGDAEEHGVLGAEDALLRVGHAELRLLVRAALAVARVDRL